MMNDIGGDADPSAAVAIRSLSVIRGNRTVLDGIDLSLPTGRLIGIIGPSGCGKTTLMRAIVGVQARVSGDIEVLGEPAGVASRRGTALALGCGAATLRRRTA